MNGIRLTPGQRRRLERQLEKRNDVRSYRRMLAVLEHARGIPVRHIADNMGVDRRSVHRWIRSYLCGHDPAVLIEKPRLGRPRRWTSDCEWQMKDALESSPEDYGYFAVNWTVPLLRDHLMERTGQLFSDDTIRRGLGDLGYVWKRPRYVLARDPEREKKKDKSCGKSGVYQPGA